LGELNFDNCKVNFDENSDTTIEDYFIDRLLKILNEEYPEANFKRK